MGTLAITEAVEEANALLPPGWSIGLEVERRFAFRERYTIVASRAGIARYSWPGIYDVRRALPAIVERIRLEA